MYPYDENNNTPSGGNTNEQRCDALLRTAATAS